MKILFISVGEKEIIRFYSDRISLKYLKDKIRKLSSFSLVKAI